MVDYDKAQREYQAKRSIHGTFMPEADFEKFYHEKICVYVPQNFRDDENWFWSGETHHVMSARIRDRRTLSELVFGQGHLVFLPGSQFRLDEPLYECFQIARMAHDGASATA